MKCMVIKMAICNHHTDSPSGLVTDFVIVTLGMNMSDVAYDKCFYREVKQKLLKLPLFCRKRLELNLMKSLVSNLQNYDVIR